MSRITLAAVAGAHGVKGEVRLKLFGAGVDSLKQHDVLLVGDREVKLEAVRAAGKDAVARFAGVGDRSAAEALRGSLVDATRLPDLSKASPIGPCAEVKAAGPTKMVRTPAGVNL